MRIIAGAVVLTIVLAQPGAAEACSCGPLLPPCARMFFGSVFVGKAIKVTRDKATQRTTFSVSEVFHGAIGKTAVVTTGTDDGSCGLTFAIGSAYIVYADGTATTLSTGSCTGTPVMIDLPGSYGTSITADGQGRYYYDLVSGRDIVVRVCNAKQTCHEVKRTVSAPTVIDLVLPR